MVHCNIVIWCGYNFIRNYKPFSIIVLQKTFKFVSSRRYFVIMNLFFTFSVCLYFRELKSSVEVSYIHVSLYYTSKRGCISKS